MLRQQDQNNRGQGSRNSHAAQPKFKGSCPELEGHIFDIGPNQVTIFTKTQKEIMVYASRQYSAKVSRAIETMDCQQSSFVLPEDPPMAKGQTEYTQTQREMIKYDAQQYTTKLDKYSQGLKDLFVTIKGQCTKSMKQILSGETNFASAEKIFDTLKFLRVIQRIAYNHCADQYQPYTIMMAMKRAFLTRQGEETSNADWYNSRTQ